jgi:hypothetical protein
MRSEGELAGVKRKRIKSGSCEMEMCAQCVQGYDHRTLESDFVWIQFTQVHAGGNETVSSPKRSKQMLTLLSYRDIKIANRSFEHLSQFKYLGATVTNQNLIQEEIKRKLNSGNACYHSVQSLLSSRLLSKNLKIRIYKTIILPVVRMGLRLGL